MTIKTALVTGAAKRIGACIASTFHQNQFDVIIHVNSSVDIGNNLVKQLNARRENSAKLLTADLNDVEAVEKLADSSLSAFGRIDVLVNNASAFYPTEVGNTSQSQWDELVNANVRAAFFLCQRLATELNNNKGSIINIVDTHADTALPRHAVYNMAKAALKTMTKSLAKDLAPDIRVNGVSPGAILWPPNLDDDNDPQVEQARKKILNAIPLQQLGTPEDIANMVYFLAAEASYITGQVIKVDGGRSLR